jgi:hypothetical protein
MASNNNFTHLKGNTMSMHDPFYLIRERMNVKVKLRTEKHGDEDVNAYDVMLSGSFANAVLSKLNPELRPMLYTQEQGDLVDGQTFNTLRFPEFGPIDWELSMGRIILVIHDEDDERESLQLINREADKFTFELLQGGTVKLGLRVKLGVMDDEEALLKLLRASNQQMLISLEQAEIEQAPDNFEQAEQLSHEPLSEARTKAEAAFFNPVGAQSPEELVLSEPDFSDPPNPEYE